jgi:hypothetical protein
MLFLESVGNENYCKARRFIPKAVLGISRRSGQVEEK